MTDRADFILTFSDADAFPEITTERLRLRQPRSTDAVIFDEIFSDPATRRYSILPSRVTPEDVRVWTDWVCNAFYTSRACAWTIVLRDSDRPIGSIRFNRIDATFRIADVGFELLPMFRGCGYISEALRAVIALGQLKFRLHGIEASCALENDASQKALQKCGFRRVPGKLVFMGRNTDRKAFDVFYLSLT